MHVFSPTAQGKLSPRIAHSDTGTLKKRRSRARSSRRALWFERLEPRLALVVEIGGFTGSDYADSSSFPPDTMGAVGPAHIVELLDGRYAVYDKTGVRDPGFKSLDGFWTSAFGFTVTGSFGPRVVYDKDSGHWFASSLDHKGAANNFLVAVSISDDPTAGWKAFQFDSDSSNSRWADFDMLGLNGEVVVVSANMHDIPGGAVVGETASVLVIPKSELVAAASAVAPTIANWTLLENVASGEISLQPAVDLEGNGLPLRLLSAANNSSSSLTTYEIGGSSASPTIEEVANGVMVSLYEPPPTIDQPGSGPGSKANIDAGDSRFSSNIVVQQMLGRDNPSLWGAHGVKIDGRAAIRWYEIDAVTNSLLQSNVIKDKKLAFNYPSIAVNDFGDVVIGYSGASLAKPMGTYVSVGQTDNGVTTFGSPMRTRNGQAEYERLDSFDENRWGDYSATVVDPIEENKFWTFQEFASGADTWAIRITEIKVPLRPLLAIGDVTVTEGNTGTMNAVFSVRLLSPSTQTIEVEWNTASDTAVAPGDYWAGGGLLTFLPTDPQPQAKTVTVAVKGDLLDEEFKERFYVNLSNAKNGLIADGRGVGTIIDNDDLPTVTLDTTPIQICENPVTCMTTAPVVAMLSAVSGRAVTVNLKFGGTATLTDDYTPSASSITIEAGSTSGSMTLTALADQVDKFKEAIVVTIDTVTNGVKNANPSQLSVKAKIVNDEDFRFYVVDNGVDALFGYETDGDLLSQSDPVAGATEPRGITTNVNGSRIWVLDNNKTVYVLDSKGQSLGSWSATSATQLQDPTGIATDGTHIWIVDKGTDTVYRFNNAASVTSGSLIASSSFKLAPSNAIPEGITTYGTTIWVVNAGVPDRVFVYNVTGTSLGNWIIDPTNISPTGITIDPTGIIPSIWIVDINKDRVYEYANARLWTSGNRTASSSFALAPGNTSPQDIVDPDSSLRMSSTENSAAGDRDSVSSSAGGDTSLAAAVWDSYALDAPVLAMTRPSDAPLSKFDWTVPQSRPAVSQWNASQRVPVSLDQADADRGLAIDKRGRAKDKAWEDLLGVLADGSRLDWPLVAEDLFLATSAERTISPTAARFVPARG